jgi:hypothetical protein
MEGGDLFDPKPNERIVKGWTLRNDVPLVTDKCDRQAAKADLPDFPFEQMERNESFEVRPEHGRRE